MRTRVALLAVAGAAALGGCADYGYGGYGPYSSLSVGVGYGGYSPYGYGYGYGYSPFDYGGWYGDPYFGWYGDSYYPGVGVYVYDSYRRPHRWNDREQHYWTQRQQSVTTTATSRSYRQPRFHENWSGFDRQSQGGRTNSTQQWGGHRHGG